ncbi:hypothetical protein AB0N20_33420, partial [Streptomyces griseoincarnatus]
CRNPHRTGRPSPVQDPSAETWLTRPQPPETEHLADAIQADLKARRLDGDLPWGISAAARARKRVKPLRDAARAMRQAAKAINGTVAAYEETQPEVVLQRREEKALRKAQRKQQLGAVAHNSAQATLQRLAPADSDDGQAGAPKLLGDYFGGHNRQQRGA